MLGKQESCAIKALTVGHQQDSQPIQNKAPSKLFCLHHELPRGKEGKLQKVLSGKLKLIPKQALDIHSLSSLSIFRNSQ